ncbi:MAG: hypothetical protein ACYTG2_18155 [Planctomycetota bacterium]|jgi:hypothetical protein
MLLHRTGTIPPFACRATFREARWPHLVACVLLGSFAAGCLAMAWEAETLEHGPLGTLALGLGLAGALLCGFGGLICASNLAASLRRSNWLMRYGPEGVLIKFRSYQNCHLPERHPTVVFLSASEIARVVMRTRATGVAFESADERGRNVFLDVHLARGDATQLAEAIARDQRTEPPSRLGLRWRSRHMPVWVPERGVIRLAWRDASSRMRPSPERALATLGATLPVEREQPQDSAWRELHRAELDGQLLRMCERGDMLGALSIARSRYDLSQRDARAFIDRLAGSH